MKIVSRKYVIWILLLINFTLSMVILIYSFYQYSKSYMSIRLIDVLINNWSLKESEGYMWVITNASILNPTEFSFEIFFCSESLYFNSYTAENYLFAQILTNVPITIKPSSTLNLTFEVQIPKQSEALLKQINNDKKLKALFDVGIDFPIAGRVRLKFYKTLT